MVSNNSLDKNNFWEPEDQLLASKISKGEVKPTALCGLAYKYGTDKCPKLWHSYTPFYFELLKDKRREIKKVLELGIGIDQVMPLVVNKIGSYKKGASLYMWRDFFPNAQIYGADIRSEALFEDTRIKTLCCDERKETDLKKLIEFTGPDIDLFVDDGSHHVSDQTFTAKTLLPLLYKNVLYIIEDVTHSKKLIRSLKDYNCWTPQISILGGNDQLVLVKHKNGIK